MKRGYFITFEGTEGSGKSTQIAAAIGHLRRRGFAPIFVREPGGTRIGESIRDLLLNKKLQEMNDGTELLLYLAARAQIVSEKIVPALKLGKIVVCDRFEDSTLAYQGFGRGLPIQAIEEVSRLFVRGRLAPDLTFLLDIHPREGMKRGGRRDRMERQSYSFHERVRRGFLKLASSHAKRFVVLDARRGRREIAETIREVLDRAIR